MDISLRVALSELKKEVDEQKTDFGKVICQYHDEIERIASERELPMRHVLNVIGIDLQPRLKRKRGPTGYNLFTQAETRGKASQDGTLLAKAAKSWKNLSQEEKNTFNADNYEHESPRKKRRHKGKHQQMVDIIKELYILVSNIVIDFSDALLTMYRLESMSSLVAILSSWRSTLKQSNILNLENLSATLHP